MPTAADLGRAATEAARSPATWVPLAAAAVLTVDDLDQEVSEWGADHAPLFGDDAASVSDDLRAAARAAYWLSAVAAPSAGAGDKATGLLTGAAAITLEDGLTDAVKDLAERERPDGSDDESFSSGHTGAASVATALARRNLDYLDLAPWLDTTLRVGLHGVTVGTAWARVEAEQHYVTDVLAGYALGHFVATFMHDAFMKPALPATAVTFRPVGRGGAVTVTVPLGR
jgi:membrane-associated phospholipid phosphatase